MFGMLSSLAELQRKLIVANTNDGLASARARGRVGGRRPKLTEDQAALAQRLYDEREKTVQQIADIVGRCVETAFTGRFCAMYLFEKNARSHHLVAHAAGLLVFALVLLVAVLAVDDGRDGSAR
jgi:hypothetical protein